MFIYDKSKNVSIFTRGKNGTTNFHNHYWMQKDHQSVGSYTDFDDSEWQFANPLPAVEDMVRGFAHSTVETSEIASNKKKQAMLRTASNNAIQMMMSKIQSEISVANDN